MIYQSYFFSLVALLAVVNGDVYMHNPRGSNDRNCERNVNRNNGNRVFDSQNNAQGGYACPRAVGSEDIQDEMGDVYFEDVDSSTGDTIQFKQNKRMYYYEGSILPIEWTSQHGCGNNSKVSCEVILQYACEDTLDPKVDDFWPWITNKAEVGTAYRGTQHFRSGNNIASPRDGVPLNADDAATNTIPDNEDAAIPDSPTDRSYGMHESYDYYQLCQRTQRNKGLYTADQLMRRNDRRGTRQNPNGNRNGLECPEERDYYPWWAPSPWIDIAVLTDNALEGEICSSSSAPGDCSDRCKYYVDNTMNYNTKGYCDVDHAAVGATVSTKINHVNWRNFNWFNNPTECTTAGFTWYEVSHADNIAIDPAAFVCAQTQFSRVNQLGNAGESEVLVSETDSAGVLRDHVVHGINANRFLWTIPSIPVAPESYFSDMTAAYKSCTLRMRYNISTADFQQWPYDANSVGASRMVDYLNNSLSVGDVNTPLLQDPYIYIGSGDSNGAKGYQFVSLAVNTNQYGRVFQDRSYSFSIKPLPTADVAANTQTDTPQIDGPLIQANLAAGGKIYNVNVRGKRGNIVQTYPAVEYDYVPNALALSKKDMIHFQWTGSDYNPRRGCNNAEGGPPDANTFSTDANANLNSRADRSNIMLVDHMANNVPTDYLGYDYMNATMTIVEKQQIEYDTLMAKAPCYDPATDSLSVKEDCYASMKRLAYLNQQLDGGSLILRAGKLCLTEEQLDAILDQENTAQNHPLNCAKINAKPYPYFDGGVVTMKKNGWFPFFSSRNNNFSNRQQTGIICVGTCPLDKNGVLQSQNPAVSGRSVTNIAASTCQDTASGDQPNSNGATSCISPNATILTTESKSNQEGDNDNMGDGDKSGCSDLIHSFTSSLGLDGKNKVEEDVALAIGLLFVGLFSMWLAYFLYNRHQLKYGDKEGSFRDDTSWLSVGFFATCTSWCSSERKIPVKQAEMI